MKLQIRVRYMLLGIACLAVLMGGVRYVVPECRLRWAVNTECAKYYQIQVRYHDGMIRTQVWYLGELPKFKKELGAFEYDRLVNEAQAEMRQHEKERRPYQFALRYPWLAPPPGKAAQSFYRMMKYGTSPEGDFFSQAGEQAPEFAP